MSGVGSRRRLRNMFRAKRLLLPVQWPRLAEFGQDRARLLQIDRSEAFGEPVVDRRQQLPRLRAPALPGPQASETRRRAEFEQLGGLAVRHADRGAQLSFGLDRVGLIPLKQELAMKAILPERRRIAFEPQVPQPVRDV